MDILKAALKAVSLAQDPHLRLSAGAIEGEIHLHRSEDLIQAFGSDREERIFWINISSTLYDI